MVERHVALGEGHLAKQEALIAGLEHKGRDTVNARAFLTTLRETQALHLQHRERLLAELALTDHLIPFVPFASAHTTSHRLTCRRSSKRWQPKRIGIFGDECVPLRLKHAGAKTFQFGQLSGELF